MQAEVLYDQIPDLDRVFRCPFDSVVRLDGIMGLTLSRCPPFQTQLWICEPHTEIYDHAHPNVETLLVYLCGDLVLRVDGRAFRFDAESTQTNSRKRRGATLEVPAGVKHGLSVGPLGGAFISIQKWPDGEPTLSTDQDWEGRPLGPLHSARLRAVH